MRSNYEMIRAIEKHGDTVRRLCLIHLKNHEDTEDIFQTVFLKYALHEDAFESSQHENAWMIRVTLNACRDIMRRIWSSRTVSLEELMEVPDQMEDPHREVLEAVLSLPEKYRIPIYLHYYEGYTAPEIGGLLKKNVNTVYSLLNRGKIMLKEVLEDE